MVGLHEHVVGPLAQPDRPRVLVHQTAAGDDGRRQGQAVAVGVEVQLVVEAHGGQSALHLDLHRIGEHSR